MRTVFKYPIEIVDDPYVIAPVGAHFIHVGEDPFCSLCVWAEVDTERSKVKHSLLIVRTGHPLPDSGFSYFGSVKDGPFMWHFYQRGSTHSKADRSVRAPLNATEPTRASALPGGEA